LPIALTKFLILSDCFSAGLRYDSSPAGKWPPQLNPAVIVCQLEKWSAG
jgi:hypothetical protein